MRALVLLLQALCAYAVLTHLETVPIKGYYNYIRTEPLKDGAGVVVVSMLEMGTATLLEVNAEGALAVEAPHPPFEYYAPPIALAAFGDGYRTVVYSNGCINVTDYARGGVPKSTKCLEYPGKYGTENMLGATASLAVFAAIRGSPFALDLATGARIPLDGCGQGYSESLAMNPLPSGFAYYSGSDLCLFTANATLRAVHPLPSWSYIRVVERPSGEVVVAGLDRAAGKVATRVFPRAGGYYDYVAPPLEYAEISLTALPSGTAIAIFGDYAVEYQGKQGTISLEGDERLKGARHAFMPRGTSEVVDVVLKDQKVTLERYSVADAPPQKSSSDNSWKYAVGAVSGATFVAIVGASIWTQRRRQSPTVDEELHDKVESDVE